MRVVGHQEQGAFHWGGPALSCGREGLGIKMNDQAPDSAPELGSATPTTPVSLVHVGGGVSADLEAWGHVGHLVLLQRLVAPHGDSPVERCLFWCETCHLWLLARLVEPND